MKIYIINSIAKSYILNIKIRPLVTECALKIKLVDGTSSAHSFNPYAYFGHSWSYFDIKNLRLVILYLFVFVCIVDAFCTFFLLNWILKCFCVIDVYTQYDIHMYFYCVTYDQCVVFTIWDINIILFDMRFSL